MKYKLVACDFDDTLLRTDDTVGGRCRAAIAAYVRAGGTFMITTGRMFASVEKRLADVGLTQNMPVAGQQGAQIMESVTRKELFWKTLPPDLSLAVLEEAERRGFYTQTYDREHIILNEKTDAGYGKTYIQRLRVPAIFTGGQPLSEYCRERGLTGPKVLVFIPPEQMDAELAHFRELTGERAIINTSMPYMMEVLDPATGKDKACDFIAARLGITIDEVAAIGDSMNDYTMIAHAGLGAAVANALPAVRAAAKIVVASNDDDGVAELIENYCM